MSLILHISASDINNDSRILKAIDVGREAGFRTGFVGLSERRKASSHQSNEYEVILAPMVRKLNFLPLFVQRLLIVFLFYSECISRIIKLEPDIVHCHDVLPLPVAVFARIFQKFHIIYDAHELESNKNYQSKTVGVIVYLMERLLLRYCSFLITVSPSIEKWYRDHLYTGPSEVILNAPIYKQNSPITRTSNLRMSLGISEKTVIFVYVGMLMKGRGIEKSLSAFEKLDIDAAIVFLGDGRLKDEILLAKKNNPNVYWHPPVVHSSVVDFISAADVGICLIENVSLSDFYSLPNKLFEMTFSGLRVVASDFPDIEAYLADVDAGSVVSLEVDEIVNGFILEANNTNSYEKSNERMSKYEWRSQADKLTQIYRKLEF